MPTMRLMGMITLAALLSLGCGDGEDRAAAAGGAGGAGGVAGSGGTGATGGSAGSSNVLSLAPGEVAEVTLTDGQSGIELATPNGDEKFLILLASNDLAASQDAYSYSLTFDAAPPSASATLVTGCSLSSDSWSTKPLVPETPPSGTAAAVGDTRAIDVPTATGFETIQAKALAVGQYAVVWADVTAAHPAVIDPAVVTEFLTDYEKTILPRERTIFGTESDLDKDGHIALVFTPLTYQTAVAFFTGCDLKSLFGCPSSNQGEYLYITPPNAIDPPYNTPNAIKEILAHETSHMIHFNRKVLKNDLSDWAESGYMIEGVGGFAQDVSGYQAGNFYVTMAGLDGIDSFSLGQTLVDGVQYDTDQRRRAARRVVLVRALVLRQGRRRRSPRRRQHQEQGRPGALALAAGLEGLHLRRAAARCGLEHRGARDRFLDHARHEQSRRHRTGSAQEPVLRLPACAERPRHRPPTRRKPLRELPRPADAGAQAAERRVGRRQPARRRRRIPRARCPALHVERVLQLDGGYGCGPARARRPNPVSATFPELRLEPERWLGYSRI